MADEEELVPEEIVEQVQHDVEVYLSEQKKPQLRRANTPPHEQSWEPASNPFNADKPCNLLNFRES